MNVCKHCCTKIQNLSVTLGGQSVLNGVNLHLHCSEWLSVVGPNGAGKTTLLRAILGEVPFQGSMEFLVQGKSLPKPRLGYVPQKITFDADAPVTVSDLLTATLTRRPVWRRGDRLTRERLKHLLEQVQAGHLLDRQIGKLSGGELQRVLLSMAITPLPDLLLLDEPMTGVDVNGLGLFYRLVDQLRQDHDISIIMVSHDLYGVAEHADRMILLNKTILADGTPQEVFQQQQIVQSLAPELWNISTLDFHAPARSPHS
jgi:zinc transport system ATP-binding protein